MTDEERLRKALQKRGDGRLIRAEAALEKIEARLDWNDIKKLDPEHALTRLHAGIMFIIEDWREGKDAGDD